MDNNFIIWITIQLILPEFKNETNEEIILREENQKVKYMEGFNSKLGKMNIKLSVELMS